MADVPPVQHELIYCNHENGFALASMRSPHEEPMLSAMRRGRAARGLAGRAVLGRIRAAARAGCGRARHARGPRSRRASRPFAASSPSRCDMGGCSCLGDAAHIVPPTGAKGMNLAVSDAVMLSEALEEFYQRWIGGRAERLFRARARPRVEGGTVRVVADRIDAPLSRRTGRSSGGCSAPSSIICATREPRRRRSRRTMWGCRWCDRRGRRP